MPHYDHKTQALIEQIVADCLALPPEERDFAATQACNANPEIADKVHQLLLTLQRIGLSEDATLPTPPPQIGDYRLLHRIGGGGMGEVWLAEQESLDRRVALKLMHPGLTKFSRSRERFKREIEALTRLEHSAICKVYAAGEEEGTPYLAMQYLEGKTLSLLLHEERQAKDKHQKNRELLDRKLSWITEIALGLQAAHEQGFIHRDVKPANIMITKEGKAVLLDFGLARFLQGNRKDLTNTGDRLGTPTYMAPEQISGTGAIDHRSDIYSLGVTLYETLCLHPPFKAATREALYREILQGETSRLSRQTRGISHDLEVVVTTAMDPDPDKRYQGAQTLAEDLIRVRQGEPIKARGLNLYHRVERWILRHRVATVFILMLNLALLVSLWYQMRYNTALAETRILAIVGTATGKLTREPATAAYLAREALRRANSIETRNEALSMLRNACINSQLKRVIPAHSTHIYALDIAANHRFLLTGSHDKTCKLWDLSRRDKPLLWTKRMAETVIRVRFCGPEDQWVLTAEKSGRLVLWDLAGTELHSYSGPAGKPATFVHATLGDDGYILLAGFNGYAQLFSLAEGRFKKMGGPLPHEDHTGALALDLKRNRFATAKGSRYPDVDFSRKTSIRLWEIRNGKPDLLRQLPLNHANPLTSLEFSPDGRYLLAAGNTYAFLYDLDNGEEGAKPITLLAGQGKIEARFIAPRNKDWIFKNDWILMTASFVDGRVTLWNKRGQQMLSPGKVATGIMKIALSQDQEQVAFACTDGASRLFSTNGKLFRSIGTIWMAPGNLETIRFNKGSSELITTSADGAIRIASCQEQSRVLHTGMAGNMVAQITPDDRFLLTAPAGGAATIWNKSGGALYKRETLADGDWGWFPAILSPDGNFFATLFYSFPDKRNHLTVWETATGKQIGLYNSPIRQISPAFLPGGTEILVYEYSPDPTANRLLNWNFISDKRQLITKPNSTEPMEIHGRPMRISPDGNRVLCLFSRWMLERADRDAPWHRRYITKSKAVGKAGDISSTGLIALSEGKGPIRIYDQEGNSLGTEIRGHTGRITWISFSPDGKLLASASKDGTVRLWQVDGTPLGNYQVREGSTYQVNFSADGHHLYSAHKNGTIRRWFVRTEDLITYAENWYRGVITTNQKEWCDHILSR